MRKQANNCANTHSSAQLRMMRMSALLWAYNGLMIISCFCGLFFNTPTLKDALLFLHDVLQSKHLPGIGSEDSDGVRGVLLLQQVTTQSHTQLCLVLVGLAARLIITGLFPLFTKQVK